MLNIYKILFLLLILEFLPGNLLAQNFWYRTNGPFGAHIESIEVTSSGDIFLATKGNGLFKSTVLQNSWTQVNGTLNDSLWITKIFTSSQGYFYIITKDYGIYKSVNGGTVWAPSTSGIPKGVDLLDIQELSDKSLIAGAASNCVYISTDFGATWLNYTTGLKPTQTVTSILPLTDNKILIGTNDGFYQSVDKGHSWGQISTNLTTSITKMTISQKGKIYACSKDSVYSSADSGKTWKHISQAQKIFNIADIIVRNSKNEVIVGSEIGILSTTNDGTSWTALDGGMDNNNISALALNQNDELLVGTTTLFFKYFSGKWYPVYQGLGYRTVNAMTSIANKPEEYAATDMGVYRTTDNGLNWVPLQKGFTKDLKTTAIAATRTGQLFAGTSTDGMYQSLDQGKSWSKLSTFPNQNISTLDTASGGKLVAGTNGAALYQSTNDGVTWTQMTGGTLPPNASIQSFIAKPNGDMYSGVLGDGLYERKVSVGTWSKSNDPLFQNVLRVGGLAYDKNGIVFVGTDRGVYRLSADLITWTGTDLPYEMTALIAGNNATYFAGSSNTSYPNVYISTNNGFNWTKNGDNGLQNYNVPSLDISGRGFIFAGTIKAGAYRSRKSTNTNFLNVDITPADTILGHGDTIAYNISIYDISDAPLDGVRVKVFDQLNNKVDSVFTNPTGKTSYKVIVPNALQDNIYPVKFDCFKDFNFLESDTITRLIDVRKRGIKLAITPADTVEADTGTIITYTIKATNSFKNPIANAFITVIDNVAGTNTSNTKTDASGSAQYQTTIPGSRAEGVYSIKFYSNTAGYESSDTLLRYVDVEHDSSFIGKTNACINRVEKYKVASSPAYTYKWKAVKGNIVNGIDTKSDVDIRWTTLGAGSVTLEKTLIATGIMTPSTKAITVNDLPPTQLTSFGSVCLNKPPYDLTEGSPPGGTYSGKGVVGGTKFDPSIAGVGTWQITYTVVNSNMCDSSLTTNITVMQIPAVTFTLPATDTTQCFYGNPLTLTGGQPANGVYSGTGVVNGVFTPKDGGSEYVTITYTYTDATGNGCSNSKTQTIHVFTPPPSGFTLPPESLSVCLYSNPIVLSGGTPAGGTYSGAGVFNGIFYPDSAGVGDHEIAYYTTLDVNNCPGRSAVTINVMDAPKRPTISAQGKILQSSEGTLSNQWYWEGTIINGATSQNYTPAKPGNYTVAVKGANGCISMSDKYPFYPDTTKGELTIASLSLKAKAGDTVTVPIKVTDAQNLLNQGITSLKGQLSFNKTMLMPVSANISGGYKFDGKAECTIDLTTGKKDTLIKFSFIAMLGDSVASFIAYDNVYAYSDTTKLPTQINVIKGIFTLTDMCYEGGPRLLSGSGSVNLMLTKPNPTGDNCKIDYQTTENGRTLLYILNYNGQVVKTIFDGEVSPGKKEANVDISDLAPGSYYIVLQTPMIKRTINLEIIR